MKGRLRFNVTLKWGLSYGKTALQRLNDNVSTAKNLIDSEKFIISVHFSSKKWFIKFADILVQPELLQKEVLTQNVSSITSKF